MSRSLLHLVLRQAEGLVSSPGSEPDSELLRRFVRSREEAAFAELLRRHGPMVWAVCRHLLADETDAEDAFQATFLALVRSAGSVRQGNALAAWLHGVAVRVATKVKRTAVRRRKREERAAGSEADRSVPEGTWDALLAAVHEEVQRLPDALRAAFVLCELEGVRQADAAARLGWKPGTLTGRLARARQRLLERLSGRGLAPALAGGTLGLGVATAAAALPEALSDKALSLLTAGEAVSPAILNLVREVTPMAIRTKLAAAVLVVAGGLGAVLFPLANAQPLGPGGGGPPGMGPGLGGGQPGPGPGGPPPGTPGGVTGPWRGDYQPPGMPYGGPGMTAGRNPWEYKFAGKPQSALEFAKMLGDYGDQGWEFAGLADFDRAEQLKAAKSNPKQFGSMTGDLSAVVIFKRPKGGVSGGGGSSGGPGPGGGLGRPVGGVGVPDGGLVGPLFGLPGADYPGLPGTTSGLVAPSGVPSLPGPGGTGVPSLPVPGGTGPKPGAGGPGMPPGGAGPLLTPGRPLTVMILKNASAVELAEVLGKVFRTGIEITPDPRTNSLILRADAKTLEDVKALVERLDVPAKAVKP